MRTSPPKFNAVRRYKSFTLKQAGLKLDEAQDKIRIGKRGKAKTLTVKRDAVGDIYIYLVCDTQSEEVELRTGKSVGFDFGLKKFLTGSDGNDITSPYFFMQNYKAIRTKSRKLSRRQKCSHNRERYRNVYLPRNAEHEGDG